MRVPREQMTLAWLLRKARPLRRSANRLLAALYVAGLGRLLGGWVLLLTTQGRRSGRRRATPLGYVPDASGGVLYLFRAAPGGADWLANLQANALVAVQVGRARRSVRAEVLRDQQQRRAALRQYLSHRTPPALAARRRLGISPLRAEESLSRAAQRDDCVLVALHLIPDGPDSVEVAMPNPRLPHEA